jgi:hypothetical protein
LTNDKLVKGGPGLTIHENTALEVASRVKQFCTFHEDVDTVVRSGKTTLLLDVSYSMSGRDKHVEGCNGDDWSRSAKCACPRRIDHLREAVSEFEALPKVSFSTDVYPDEVPEPKSSTNMLGAFTWLLEHQQERGFDSIILVSDGEPDGGWGRRDDVVEEAKKLGVPVHSIFIGRPGSEGSRFLERLAEATGGKALNADPHQIKLLSGTLASAIKGFLPERSGPEARGEDITRREPILL